MSIWMLIINFSISQMQWDGLELSNHPVQASGALQAHCSVRMRSMHMCLRMSIWMLIINFSISQMQWDELELSNHPVQSACALQAHCSVRMLALFYSRISNPPLFFFGKSYNKNQNCSETSMDRSSR